MAFPQRLAALRKQQTLTQQALAELVGVHLTQIQRYEKGDTQPTLEVIRKLAIALAVSADTLIFDPDERGPGDDLKLQFEAVRQLPPEDRQAIKAMLDGMIVKHRTKQIVGELHS
ncbi:MAG: helix-turn-helix transcriptional regulator [Pseudoxanthomonas suwonensis]|nr:helix-turn-helix transcriptional regulator [Pseudoxanthomonas suwonensis]MDO5505080.1 helix-turn-helix transcriptional regulator [Pseudoxanthomonas suwonensis]